MDMVAAIQAAKNQLEEQKKKKGVSTANSTGNNTSNLPSLSSLHPAPPTNIVSFDSKKHRASPHPYHNEADYIHPDFQYKSSNELEDDELTTTSSLSGTLPSSVVHDIALRRDSSGFDGAGLNSSLLDTVEETSNIDNSSTTRLTKSFNEISSPRAEDKIPTPTQSRSLHTVDSVPGLPLKRNAVGGGSSSGDKGNDKKVQSILNSTANNSTPITNNAATSDGETSNAKIISDSTNVSQRIDEIMSAYQGKVDSILKRNDEGTSFRTIIETASLANHHQGGGGSATVSSAASKSSKDVGIDDIMSTYKKRMDEIVEKKIQQKQAVMTATSDFNSKDNDDYDEDMEIQRQKMSSHSRPSYPRSIVDDEGSECREGAIDKSVAGSQTSKSYSQRSVYSDSQGSVNDGSAYSGLRTYGKGESYNERVEAKNKDGNQSRSSTGGENAAIDNDSKGDSRSIYSDDESSYSTEGSQSYISGASEASNELGSTYSQGYSKDSHPQDKPSDKEDSLVSFDDKHPEQDHLNRRNSLLQAKQTLARKLPKSTKSFYAEPNSTKSNLHAEIETERKFRQDLERRLAESTQREEDLTKVNKRIEKTLSDLQSQLDQVQGDARSNKYSQSEQAARIRELERKLKGEEIRVEELEREKEAIKEEYDADLEEQKDINRQLEQMVMSEEFEKELEDEINQVKELEHANRRFKVKIDMLEREKTNIAKKFETKIDELSNKNKSLEQQLSEFESKANVLETSNRNTVMELEAKLATETSRVRELELSTESAVSKYSSKVKSLEAELEDLRQSSSKIDEYEQVLGKLMERNAELEAEVKEARDDKDMANRQVELSDRRRAVKVNDLQDQVAEQKLMIEQQQETLEESVKTILKLYSLNNGKGDDMTELSEEQLDSITRAMIPRSPTKPALSTLSERTSERPWSRGRDRFEEDIDLDRTVARAVERARSRGRDRFDDLGADPKLSGRPQSRGRDRFDDSDADKSVSRSIIRARSQGRDRFDDMPVDRLEPRPRSRGRGDRSESIRQLTSRALDRDKSRSPHSVRRRTEGNLYEPSISNSLALVPVTPKDTEGGYGGRYGGGPTPQSTSRRGGSSVYDRVDSTYTEGMSYSDALIPYDSRVRPPHRSNYHHKSEHSRYSDRPSNNRYRGERDDRSRGHRSHRDKGEPRRRHRSGHGGYHEDEYGPRRGKRESLAYGEDAGRPHNRDRHRSTKNGKPRPLRDP